MDTETKMFIFFILCLVISWYVFDLFKPTLDKLTPSTKKYPRKDRKPYKTGAKGLAKDALKIGIGSFLFLPALAFIVLVLAIFIFALFSGNL